MDISRKHDIQEVERGMHSSDPLMRKVATNAQKEISKQLRDGWTRSARERLITETLKGNKDNAKQVRDDMVKHRGGRLGKGNRGELLTKAFHWQPGAYERIYG